MFHRKQGKTSLIPVRPSPPSQEEIIHDISNATRDDIVFTSIINEEDEYFDALERNDLLDDELEFEDALEETEHSVEEKYQKICKFLNLNETLAEDCDELKELIKKLEQSGKVVEKMTAELENKLTSRKNACRNTFDNS